MCGGGCRNCRGNVSRACLQLLLQRRNMVRLAQVHGARQGFGRGTWTSRRCGFSRQTFGLAALRGTPQLQKADQQQRQHTGQRPGPPGQAVAGAGGGRFGCRRCHHRCRRAGDGGRRGRSGAGRQGRFAGGRCRRQRRNHRGSRSRRHDRSCRSRRAGYRCRYQHRCLHGRCGGNRRRRGSGCRQLHQSIAVLFVIGMLLADQRTRFFCRDGERLLCRGHGQGRAFLEQVDVVGHEGIGIGVQDRQQGLILCGTSRAVGRGDAADHGAGPGLDHLGGAGNRCGSRRGALRQYGRAGRQAEYACQQQGRGVGGAHGVLQDLEHARDKSMAGRVPQARSHQEAAPCGAG